MKLKIFLSILLILILAPLGMCYYPKLLGKKMVITGTVPEGMKIEVSTYFESSNCEEQSLTHLPAQAETHPVFTTATYDEREKSYTAEAQLEYYSPLCSWYPIMIFVRGSHPQAKSSNNATENIHIATFSLMNKNDNQSAQAICRWYDSFSYSNNKYPNIECYNPTGHYQYSTREGVEKFILNITMEEKKGGGFFHYTEDPTYTPPKTFVPKKNDMPTETEQGQ